MTSAFLLCSLACFAATEPASDAAPPPEAPKGILPIPDYGGDLFDRSHLTGDWGGARTSLAEHGIQFDAHFNQYLQSVTSGGVARKTRYGGSLAYEINFDLMRMDLMDLAFVTLRAESRYGDSVNPYAGTILPANTDALFPLTRELDEDVPFTITTLCFTKLLTPEFGFLIGKFDTLSGDPNEFASGRGVTQFMNANFVFNGVLGLRLPYSTLGAGVIWMPSSRFSIISTIMNTTDSSTTTGFSDFDEGLTWTTEAHFQYRLGTLPGGVGAGFLYSFDQEFAKVSSRYVFRPGEGLVPQKADDTWALYFSGWQYLWVKDPSDAPINITDGVPDHQGIGLFARLGFADKNTNPAEWSISGGIGGRGIIPSRDDDVFGIGYFYTSLQTGRLSGFTGLRDHSQGFEAFYSIALTPAAHLTLDAQVLETPTSRLDTAVVLGVRLGIEF